VLAGVQVQHELDQRPVQTRHFASHHHEARAGHPGGGLKIQPAPRKTQINVVARREIQAGRLAHPPDLDIGRLVRPLRHALLR